MFDEATLAIAARISERNAASSKFAPHPARAPTPTPTAKTVTVSKTTPAPATSAPNVPTPDQLRAEFERSGQLRAEFPSFECFAAYRRAEARGLIKVLNPRVKRA